MKWPVSFFSGLRRFPVYSLPRKPDGGLALQRNKPGLSCDNKPIPSLELPDRLIFPLLDYAKHKVKPEVVVGQTVSIGDTLATGVIASISGTVSAIHSHPVIHPSYKEALCVVLDTDHSLNDESPAFTTLQQAELQRIKLAGVNGLGGAGFDTFTKLDTARVHNGKVSILLINAVECEPLISCDEALIRSDSASIVDAIHCLIELTECDRCVLAIEDDKKVAVDVLTASIAEKADSNKIPIELVSLSAIYPSGAERVLIQRITGQSLKSGQRAAETGIVCLNVATVVAAWRAQSGHPMISRVVTIAGSAASKSTNVRVRIGTSVDEVLKQTGNLPHSDLPATSRPRIRAGGPLSGFDLHTLSVPISATTNCIGIESPLVKTPAAPCIRCSRCSDVCPVNLVPQQLLWYSSGNDIDSARRFGLDECIECGCCDIVCPSSIELTSIFRHARSIHKEQQHIKAEAAIARVRFEKHENRVAVREQRTRQLREEKKERIAATQNPVADAIARAKARRKKQ